MSTVRPRRPAAAVEPLFEESLIWVGHAPRWNVGPWLAYSEGLPLISRYAKHTRRRLPTPSVIAPDLRALRSMLLNGIGTSVLPEYLVPDGLRVVERLRRPVTNTLWLVVGRRRAANPSVSSVVERLRSLRS